MKLDQFISQALIDIANGIKKAQKEYENIGGQVNPRGLNYIHPDILAVQHKETSRIGQIIEFDLTVTGGGKIEGSAKAGIEVMDIGLSGKVQGTSETGHLNKLRFKIPVIFPKSVYKEDEDPNG